MAIIYTFFSALITAAANLLIRRGLDVTENAKGDPYIAYRFFTAALMVIPIILMRHGKIAIDPYMALVGLAGGLALGALQYTIGRCLYFGPPAISFIFVSAACVIPPIILFFIFGEEFGHGYSVYNLLGSVIVLLGLFWMAKSQGLGAAKDFKRWALWVGLAFLCGVFHQLILQWRALLLKEGLPHSPFLPFHTGAAEGDFYMIVGFCTAAICQMFFQKPKSIPKLESKQILICGIFTGILNGVSGYFLLRGTEVAMTDVEKAIIFPLFTVLLITFCNLWARYLYKEKINWRANVLCMAGIGIGMR